MYAEHAAVNQACCMWGRAAHSACMPPCKLMHAEVGSMCRDSTVVLGKTAAASGPVQRCTQAQ